MFARTSWEARATESTSRASSNVFAGAARFRRWPLVGSVPAMPDTEQRWDFTGLKAMYINGTLKRSPEVSNTEGLIEVSASIMRRHGVEVEVLRTIDHDIATGVYPDMTEHGWASDEWPRSGKGSVPRTSWLSRGRSGWETTPA
jgi:hypothetical protein